MNWPTFNVKMPATKMGLNVKCFMHLYSPPFHFTPYPVSWFTSTVMQPSINISLQNAAPTLQGTHKYSSICYIMLWHLKPPHVYMPQSFFFSRSKWLKVSSISVLSRWPTVVHHHQEHDGGRGAGGICGGLWLATAGSEPHVSERGHVPSQAAGQHPAPATAGRHGFHPAHCHRQQWVSVHGAGTRCV